MPTTEVTPLVPRSEATPRTKASFLSFLRAFWPMAFISFGGPPAHVALFHDKFVDQPRAHPQIPNQPQIEESTFLELYALSQSLPGPGSTQLAASLGATFGGAIGAAITFLVWHLPGFIIMTLAGIWFHSHLNDKESVLLIQTLTDRSVGLIAAAFAYVLLAAFKIVKKNCSTNHFKMIIAIVSLFFALLVPPKQTSWVFITLLVLGGVAYSIYDYILSAQGNTENLVQLNYDDWESQVSPFTGMVLISIVGIATLVITLLPSSYPGNRLLQTFWRIGISVFGGGIVVIPMLLNEFVDSKLLPTSVFLAGFGLFGCVPGPMFNLAPFLGACVLSVRGAFYGSIGLFGPGVILQVGLLPFWERVRRNRASKVFLQGTDAAATGLIVAGVGMLLRKAMVGPTSYALTCSAAVMSIMFKVSPPVNIVMHGLSGLILAYFNIGAPFHAPSVTNA